MIYVVGAGWRSRLVACWLLGRRRARRTGTRSRLLEVKEPAVGAEP